jgi:arsenate reductase
MSDKTYNVLILCTGNSARSIMAEALFNMIGKGRFKAYSAGSHPAGKVNLYAIEQVEKLGYPVDNLRSKSWDEFATPDAPQMDFVITVCDKAAGETCPAWSGTPIYAHWGVEDPVLQTGSDDDKRKAFQTACRYLMNRVQLFANLPLSSLDRLAIKREMDHIGQVKDL